MERNTPLAVPIVRSQEDQQSPLANKEFLLQDLVNRFILAILEHCSTNARMIGRRIAAKLNELINTSSLEFSAGKFPHIDTSSACRNGHLEMLSLHDVPNVARAVRDNVHAALSTQAIIEQTGDAAKAHSFAECL